MNAPKLRFKEFNDEWKYEKLSSITSNISSGKISKKLVDGEYNVYGSMGIIGTSNFYDYDGEKVLVARVGANAGSVNKINEKCCISDNTLVLESNNILNDFLYFSLCYFNPKKLIFGSGQPLVTGSQLKNIIIGVPTILEQKKISLFMSLLDKKIELQSKKIEALKLYKKGLINIIIKQSDFNKVALKELIQEYNERTTVHNQYEVISSTSNGLFLQKEYFNKQPASQNNIGYKILKKGQLVFSPQNLWMGNININTKYEIGIVSPSYKVYEINTNKIDINFFNYWIKTPKALYQYLISSEQGASIVRRNLNIELFNEIIVELPSKTKQKIVGTNIKNLDVKISLENEKMLKLLELKKGLMQNLFV